MRKVRGLLAKAADDAVTDEEAGSFLAKANELMLRYSIAEEDLGNPTEESKYGLTTVWEGRAAPSFTNFYTDLLEKHFNVKPVMIRLPRGMSRLVVYGKQDDCIWAHHVYDFLTEKFYSLWLNYKRYDPTIMEAHRGSYYSGLHHGLNTKLNEAKQSVSKETIKGQNALMVLKNNLAEAVKRDLPGLTRHGTKSFEIRSAEAREAGIMDGRTIEIMKSLPENSSNTQISHAE